MVTECFGIRIWDMTDSGVVFVATMYDMMRVVLPSALCLFVWRVFVTNKTQPVMFLGLEQATSTPYQQPPPSRFLKVLYAATGVTAFCIGVLAFNFQLHIQQLLADYLRT